MDQQNSSVFERAPVWRRVPWHWLATAVIAVVLAVTFWWRPSPPQPGANAQASAEARRPVVQVQPVERGEFTLRASYVGEFTADAADLAAEAAGRLLSVSVRLGQSVKAGQELARVDDRALVLQLQEARALDELASANERRAAAALAAVQAELGRSEGLLTQKLVSAQAVDTLRARLESASADVAAALAQRNQAKARASVLEEQIRTCRIVAPAAGTISERYRDPGAFVTPGTPIVRWVGQGSLRVRFKIPEKSAHLVKLGMPVSLRVAATADAVAGRVRGFGAEVSRAERVMLAEAELDGAPPAGGLPGMFAEVELTQSVVEDALLVPAAAVVTRVDDQGNEVRGVFVLDGERAAWRPLSVLGQAGDKIAVTGLVAAAQPVITAGHAELKDGVAVRLAATEQR
jgi:RND family efflux transporter MFP subunit